VAARSGDGAGGDDHGAFGAAVLTVHSGRQVFKSAMPADLFGEFVGSEQLSLLALLAGHIHEEVTEAIT
jgi:hypothetical protein